MKSETQKILLIRYQVFPHKYRIHKQASNLWSGFKECQRGLTSADDEVLCPKLKCLDSLFDVGIQININVTNKNMVVVVAFLEHNNKLLEYELYTIR